MPRAPIAIAAALHLFAVAISGSAARAQEAPSLPTPEGRVVRDVWRESFQSGRKIGWSHERLVELPDAPATEARFVETVEQWAPRDGGVNVFHSRVETDSAGSVLALAREEETAYGRTHCEARRSDEGRVSWTVRSRELPVVEGTTSEDVVDASIVRLLICRGALPPGERRLHTLRLPERGVDDHTIRGEREADGTIRIDLLDDDGDDDGDDGEVESRIWYRPDGSLLREDDPDDLVEDDPGPAAARYRAGPLAAIGGRGDQR